MRFVILGAPRTGTNMLCTLLGSHPDVLCHHELFNPRGIFVALEHRGGGLDLGSMDDRDRDPLAFLDRVWATDLGHSHVGFKMTHRQNEAAFDAVVDDPGVRKIVLRREGRVRTYVSQLIAEQTDQWEVYDERELTARQPVAVDPAGLREAVAANDRYYRQLEQTLRATGQPFLRVRYEHLAAAREQDRLVEFLELRRAPLAVRSVRQNGAPLRALVSNADELEAALADSELQDELDEPDGLLNRRFAATELTGPDLWSASHGSAAGSPELGAGILYYAIAYSLRASLCVCLGSGGGFVPRLMRQAQRDLALPDGRTILVDGGAHVSPAKRELWGTPDWIEPDSWFRRHFPDVEVVEGLTEAAHRDVFVPQGLEIDYLHIDADHHYDAVRRDFELFSPLVRDEGVITLHDTRNRREPCGVPQLVEEIRRDGVYAVVDFPIRYGTAVLKRNPR